VLAENNVSTTCEITPEETSFWLTREDGCFPQCENTDCSVCMGRGGEIVEPKAYLVVKVYDSGLGLAQKVCNVFFAPQNKGPWNALVTRVLPAFSDSVGAERRLDLLMLRGALANGCFGAKPRCECTLDSVCEGCSTSTATWYQANQFGELMPMGINDWWNGVTRAAGYIDKGMPWLRCYN
jgi:hypothetical protein